MIRSTHLVGCCPEIDESLADVAASSEDACDAAVSAVVMIRHLDEIATMIKSRDDTHLIEGRFLWPHEIRETVAQSNCDSDQKVECPFCDIAEESVVAQSLHAVAVRDGYPVSDGHTLVILKIHAETLFSQSTEIQTDVWRLVAKVRDELRSRYNPDGFNVGLNDGRAGGQTVGHAHVHVIPRFDGDVADPRGGIRWVLPERAAYWDQ